MEDEMLLRDGLIALAARIAARPGGHERIVRVLEETLAGVNPGARGFVTRGTATALSVLASGLADAAAAAAHIADHALIILPPQ